MSDRDRAAQEGTAALKEAEAAAARKAEDDLAADRDRRRAEQDSRDRRKALDQASQARSVADDVDPDRLQSIKQVLAAEGAHGVEKKFGKESLSSPEFKLAARQRDMVRKREQNLARKGGEEAAQRGAAATATAERGTTTERGRGAERQQKDRERADTVTERPESARDRLLRDVRERERLRDSTRDRGERGR